MTPVIIAEEFFYILYFSTIELGHPGNQVHTIAYSDLKR